MIKCSGNTFFREVIIIIFRKYRNNILLLVSLILFSIFVNYMSVRLANLYFINSNSNFNRNSISFSFYSPKNKQTSGNISKSCVFTGNHKVAVYSRLQDSGMDVYKVIYSNIRMKLSSGEYFTDGELNNDNGFYAVTGTLAGEIVDTNNLTISGHHYTIKGVFEDKKKPSNNYTMYINDNSDLITLNTVFVLDGNNKHEIEKAFAEIKKNAEASNLEIKIYENENVTLEHFMHYQKPIIIVFVLTIIIIFFLNFAFSVFWLYSNQRLIAVLNLAGKNYYSIIIKLYCTISFTGNIIGTMIAILIIGSSDDFLTEITEAVAMVIIEYAAINIGFIYLKMKSTKEILEIDYE